VICVSTANLETASQHRPPTRSRAIALLQLFRLPNIFTAVADVAMGFLVTRGNLQPISLFAALAAASCLLYVAGMVLNDVFDREVDSRERPDRPIPSGSVPLGMATAFGWGLLVSGAALGWIASFLSGNWRAGVVASLLSLCVVLYDWTLKRTPLAPLLMGACRTLNVLLGMSLGPSTTELMTLNVRWSSPAAWSIAAGLGVYIVGVTFFARTEARASSRARLIAGTLVMIAGMVLMASAPVWPDQNGAPLLFVTRQGWYLFWLVLMLLVARRCVAAVVQPAPARVQAAVRNAIHSIIVLDAAVCVGFAGPFWGLAVLLLMAPTLLLTQWLKAT
jgi:4-hydroxybenzoate polyprenyltransferase